MNKDIFIEELRKKLKRLPKEEMDNALEYYIEYFEEAGIENEQEVLKELDSPANIASQLLADYAFKSDNINVSSKKRGLSSVWFIILAIMASPIALPLALAFVMVVFAMCLVVASLIFAVSIVAVALFVSGVVIVVAGASVMTQGFSTAIMFMGIGITFIGIGSLGGATAVIYTPKVFRKIIGFVRKSLGKMRKSTKREGL